MISFQWEQQERYKRTVLQRCVVGLLLLCGMLGMVASAVSRTKNATFDPCALLTKVEVEAVLGGPIKDGVRKTAGREEPGEGDPSPLLDAAMCSYERVQVQNDSTSSRKLSIIVGKFRSQEEAVAYFKEDCGEEEGLAAPLPMPGLGDNACSLGALASVLKNDTKLLILYDTGDPKDFDLATPQALTIARSITAPLAAKAASRL